MRFRPPALALLVVGLAVLAGIALAAIRRAPPSQPPPSPPPPAAASAIADPLTAYRGRTVLLLMGMPGCPGTEKASAFLASYAARKPPQVELLRIDVPAPGGRLEPIVAGALPFTHRNDDGRVVAAALEFFSYPTFYVIDRDGAVRYAGPFEQDKAEAMVAALAAEQPGDAKPPFSPPLAAPGSTAADFTGPSLSGTALSLREAMGDRATLLFFGKTTCPFSREAAQSLPALAQEHAERGLRVVVVNQGEQAADIRAFYDGLGLPVVVDADAAISLGKYGVWAVPYCFVLDGQGTVLARQPYTAEAGKALVAKSLGLAHDVVLPNAGAG